MRIFSQEKDRPEVLREIIFSMPSAELRKGVSWHIGNVTILDEDGIYFRIGRISRSTLETYKDGNFIDQEFETAPYTHVVLDTKLEVCAIAQKAKLSPKPIGTAHRLVELLSKSAEERLYDVEFEIDQINDPADFITYLHKAHLIPSFWVTFSRPNPFDIETDFVKPLVSFLEKSNGDRGRVEMHARDGLAPATLEAVVRSVAATGEDAGAVIEEEDGKRVAKRLRGNPVVIPEQDPTDDQQRRRLLGLVRERYLTIRGNNGGHDNK